MPVFDFTFRQCTLSLPPVDGTCPNKLNGVQASFSVQNYQKRLPNSFNVNDSGCATPPAPHLLPC